MTDLTEAMRIDPAARTGPLDVEKTLPDVSPELGPNIPEVVQEIDPDREKRLTQELMLICVMRIHQPMM